VERIVTYVSNRLDGLERVARSTPNVFVPAPEDRDAAWGLAYRQGDDILTKKRPIRAGAELEIEELLRNAQTDRAFLHVGQPTPRGFSREDVGPHRFEHFTFSCIGASTFEPKEPLDLLPAFEYWAHQNAAQTLFARLLTILEREGAAADAPPALVRSAFRELHSLTGGASFGAVLGNGRRSYTYARAMDLAFTHREEPIGSPRAGEPTFRAVVLVVGDTGGLPADFKRAPSRDVFGVIEPDGALELGEA
jgi:hypothetical protein